MCFKVAYNFKPSLNKPEREFYRIYNICTFFVLQVCNENKEVKMFLTCMLLQAFGLHVHSEDEHSHGHGDGVTMEPYVGYGLAAMAGKTHLHITCI